MTIIIIVNRYDMTVYSFTFGKKLFIIWPTCWLTRMVICLGKLFFFKSVFLLFFNFSTAALILIHWDRSLSVVRIFYSNLENVLPSHQLHCRIFGYFRLAYSGRSRLDFWIVIHYSHTSVFLWGIDCYKSWQVSSHIWWPLLLWYF